MLQRRVSKNIENQITSLNVEKAKSHAEYPKSARLRNPASKLIVFEIIKLIEKLLNTVKMVVFMQKLIKKRK